MDVKQIIISYNALKDACEAMVKPITIDLYDTETVMGMPKPWKTALEVISEGCETIQAVLEDMEDDIEFLQKAIYDDGDIDKSRKFIKDILLDGPPVPKPFKPTNAVKLAENIFLRTG